MAYKGKYSVVNTSKYIGKNTNIVFRSLWEYSMMKEFDHNKSVTRWSSESVIIPYESMHDGKRHRYFVDFYVENDDGEKFLIEVKPMKQSLPPDTRKRKTPKGRISRRYVNEVKTWAQNLSKWKAAHKYSQHQGWKFMVLTEKGVSEKWKEYLEE